MKITDIQRRRTSFAVYVVYNKRRTGELCEKSHEEEEEAVKKGRTILRAGT